MSRTKIKRWLFILLCIYIVSVVLLNVLPLRLAESLNEMHFLEFRADYLTHLLIFLPWSLFQFLFFRKRKIIWFFIGLVFAVAIESVQYYLPHRSFNPYDLLFNITGLCLSYLIFIGVNLRLDDYFSKKKRLKRKRLV